MDHMIDVSRAARMTGVSRHEIQHHISTGNLPAFDGRVYVSALREIYPDFDASPSSMVEVVSKIREDAWLKACRDDKPHTWEELQEENRNLRRELAFYQTQCRFYRGVVKDIKGMLADLETRLQPGQKPFLAAVCHWIEGKLRLRH